MSIINNTKLLVASRTNFTLMFLETDESSFDKIIMILTGLNSKDVNDPPSQRLKTLTDIDFNLNEKLTNLDS